MWESCTPGFRLELLVQDGRATASALRAVGVCPSTAQALCKTLWFSRRCWAGCRHATPGTEIRCGEQPSCPRPMGSQPLPHRQEAYKATPPTPSMQTCLPESLHSWAQARTFPFFDQKQSFLSGSDDLPQRTHVLAKDVHYPSVEEKTKHKKGLLLIPNSHTVDVKSPECCKTTTLFQFSCSVVSDSLWPHGLQ